MRSFVLRGRIRYLSQTASLLVISGLVAGCSSGFSRFDSSLMTSAAPKAASANGSNPYPSDLDPTTTASTKRRFAPVNSVGANASPATATTPRGVYYHDPEPLYAERQPRRAQPQEPRYIAPQPERQPYPVANNSSAIPQYQMEQSVEKNALPRLQSTTSTKRNLDMVQTSSIDREALARRSTKPRVISAQPFPGDANPKQDNSAQPQRVASKVPQHAVSGEKRPSNGWSRAGGTMITVRSGETLYNISKRYGVPVKALMQANGIVSADQVQTGQNIVIPNYVYSNRSTVSAPDNNPKTRASASHTGMIGEVDTTKAAIPSRRPRVITANRVQPVIKAPTENFDEPDRSIVTGSIKPNPITSSSIYVVRSGDSLSRIASRSGVNISDIKAHNNLSDNAIRIGQKLRIPAARSTTKTAAVNDGYGVDPIITGTAKPTTSIIKPKNADISTRRQVFPGDEAPKSTGISEFRWPVRGRVISKFGDKSGSQKNDGIDISVPEGTAVRAVENGLVLYVGEEVKKYGRLILVRHEDGWVSAYAHNKSYEVSKGDTIRRGQIIARSGRTGITSQPKLHFELRRNSKPVNPMKHLGSA